MATFWRRIKVPLGIEVGLSRDDFVLDGDPAPPHKGVASPIFGPRLFWPNGCKHMKMPIGTEVGIGLRDIVLGGNSAPLP